MTAKSRNCRECGTVLPPDATSPICAACSERASGKHADSTLPISRIETAADDTGEKGGTPEKAEPEIPAQIQYFGDYELVEEIARGGMGVVYRARQTTLNRNVAVKMILSGNLASETEVRRFQTEAEAAASLQHPGIVAIHEVGEHEGRHYFSMDYIEGKSLGEIVHGKPLAVDRAVRLAMAIADAMQYAHERSILHRDLKPQNILIDAKDQARITDFGLARKIEGGSGMTRSLAVMGTPAYMSPEQASGRNREVGPASDVYSLGAILYEMITGCPPFSGATAVETLKEVLEREPKSPREHNAKVSADLETICLKCLEKNPDRRYSSARELKEDLQRFLNYEPIHARPAGKVWKSWSWFQRNPWAIAGFLTGSILLLLCTVYGLWEQNQFLRIKTTSPDKIPVELPNSPVVPFFLSLPVILIIIQFFGQDFRKHVKHSLTVIHPVNPPRQFLHGIIGIGCVLYSVVMICGFIKSWVWTGFDFVFPLVWTAIDTFGFGFEIAGLLSLLVLIWMGVNMMWEAVGTHESAMYLDIVNRTVDRQLRQQLNRRAINGLAWFIGFSLVNLFTVIVFSQSHSRESLDSLIIEVISFFAVILLFLITIEVFLRRWNFLWYFLSGAMIIFLAYLYCIWNLPSNPVGIVGIGFGAMSSINIGLLLHLRSVTGAALMNPGSFRFKVPGQMRKLRNDLGISIALLCILITGFHLIENRRGKNALEEFQQDLETKGGALDWRELVPEDVPVHLNFADHPLINAIASAKSVLNTTWKSPDQVHTSETPLKDLLGYISYRSLDHENSNSISYDEPWLRADNREALLLLMLPEFDHGASFGYNGWLRKQVFTEGLSPEMAAYDYLDAIESYKPESYERRLNPVMIADAVRRRINLPGQIYRNTAVGLLDAVQDFEHPITERWLDLGFTTSLLKNRLISNRTDSLSVNLLIKEALELYEPEIELLREAAKLPYSQFTNLVRSGSGNNPFESEPNRVGFLHLIWLLRVHTAMEISLERPDSALEDLRIIHRLAELMTVNNLTQLSFLGFKSWAWLLMAFKDGLISNAWKESHLQEIQSWFSSANLIQELNDAIRYWEPARITHHTVSDYVQFLENEQRGHYHWTGLTRNLIRISPKGWQRLNQLYVCQFLVSQSRSLFDVEKVRLFPDEMRAGFDYKRDFLRSGSPFHLLLTRDFFHQVMIARYAYVQSYLQQAEIVCGHERFRIAEGHYPEKLEELSPRFISRIPMDVMSGKPYHYQLRKDGYFLLYSVGGNGKDDNASVHITPSGYAYSYDLIWDRFFCGNPAVRFDQ